MPFAPIFTPPPWLANPHIQTLWPKLFRRLPQLPLTSQRLVLADGDFIDLAWAAEASGPPVLLLHGLEGNLRSHYVLPTMQALARAGFTPGLMFLRGASGTPNRLARSYHSGASDDLAEVLALLARADRPIWGAVGFSLGGNLLLKYLGETGDQSLLTAAAAISVPFVLADAATRLEHGASRLYQSYLLNRLKHSYARKRAALPALPPVDLTRIATLRQYDELITAPVNGFAGADDYYSRCSSINFLPAVTTPTLILHSLDDPFMYPRDTPTPAMVGPGVELAIQRYGGHVGFIDGPLPWRPGWLIDRVVPAFLCRQRERENRGS